MIKWDFEEFISQNTVFYSGAYHLQFVKISKLILVIILNLEFCSELNFNNDFRSEIK
jgi:hypothetical protein